MTNPIKLMPNALATMDKALEANKGIRLTFETKQAATTFRHNCYKLRTKIRRENQKVFDPEHPSWNTCPYDIITIVQKDNVLEFVRGDVYIDFVAEEIL